MTFQNLTNLQSFAVVALFLVRLLQAGTLPDDPRAPLFKAIRSGDVAEVERTLAAVPNINGREVVPTKPRLDDPSDKKEMLGDTPLMVATRGDSLELVKLLLAHGADVNASGEAGFTPLMEAVRCGHSATAVLLLEKGAKPNQTNINGDTALLFAANDGDVLSITALLDHGADINGGTGWTPLTEAAYNGQDNAVALLKMKGADVNLRRGNVMTPVECAIVQHYDGIATLLRNAGGKGRSADVLARDNEMLQAKMPKQAGTDGRQLQGKALRFSKNRLLTPEDQTVIEAALTDMLAYQGKGGLLGPAALRDVALINVTAAGPGLFSDDQLNGELDVTQANDVTRGMREHLQQRNSVTASIKAFKARNRHIRLIDEKRGDSRFDKLSFDYPPTRGWVQICLPAYSKLHDAVVLRFAAGPSAHGMAGTYFLTKSQGKWQVKWRNFAYYA